jgi:aspartate aminotransferase-like enzyme
MKSTAPLTFKIASEKKEFEQIHKLNYRTFVEEIPQHAVNPARILIDKFDQENTYVICLRGDQLLGMVVVRGKRPFSLDQKLADLDSYLPQGRSVCEIRLLSVERDYRNGLVFRGLAKLLAQHCRSQGYDLAVISGSVKQQKLYEALGFVPFGPLVGKDDTMFQPMYLSLDTYKTHTRSYLEPPARRPRSKGKVNLLPGPVAVRRDVRQALIDQPVSHRSDSFVEDFQQTKKLLCQLVGCQYVEIFMGSGTLANDVIAGQLALTARMGIILSNGEFGERLIDHATRFGLPFRTVQMEWSKIFCRPDIEQLIEATPNVGWVWAAHCETSSGVLNDMAMLKEVCAVRGILLCMDCISSIGTVPVDLSGVYLASGVSGKGLGAFSGLSMVFYNQRIPPTPNALPRYLDLGLYAENKGVPFTVSSNLLYALRTALRRFESHKPFDEIRDLSLWVRSRLHDLGFEIVTPEEHGSPAVVTIALPQTMSSERVGGQLEETGYCLSYKSNYLLKRNWIQICLMGECPASKVMPLLDLLQELSYSLRRAS